MSMTATAIELQSLTAINLRRLCMLLLLVLWLMLREQKQSAPLLIGLLFSHTLLMRLILISTSMLMLGKQASGTTNT